MQKSKQMLTLMTLVILMICIKKIVQTLTTLKAEIKLGVVKIDIDLMQELLDCLKRITDESKTIKLPNLGKRDKLHLSGTNYDFYFDLNRNGHRLPKCTFQLRETNHKSDILFRFDLIGREHPNPPGNYPYSRQIMECPHVHFSTYKNFGIKVALPLSDPLVRLNISKDDMQNLLICLKKTLHRLNVANINSFIYTEDTTLDI